MKKYTIQIILTLISIFISIYFYSLLPDTMASHWNAQGVVDGYSSKLFNVVFFPVLGIFLFLLFFFIPKIDPKYKNIKTFEKTYQLFISSFLVFVILLQLEVYLWNTGTKIPMEIFMPILMGYLYIVMALLIKNAKQNYTIGIRTPWTLYSENVWNRTHALGFKLFLISGILSLLSIFFSKYSFIVVIASILVSTLILFVYSYLEYRKEVG